MMNEIFVNEIMSINELEMVAGGTNRECKELKAALPQVAGLFGMRNMRESDVVAWLNDCLGIKAKKEFLPMQPGDVPITYADSSALENDFGFTPQIGIREGLRKFAEWYKEYYR